MNLSQEQAQALVDFYVKNTTEAHEAPFRAYVEMKQGWTDEVMKTYGKDIEPGGRHFQSVANLLATLGPRLDAESRSAMDLTGVGSHPAFVEAFIRFADALGQGRPTPEGKPSPLGQANPSAPGPRSAAEAIYPHLAKGA